MATGFMNWIVAFIQPFQLEKVVDALREIPGFPGMTVTDAQGFGRLLAHPPRPGESTEVEAFRPRVRLEIACPGTQVSEIAETIRRTARTGNPGDGLVLVSDLAWAYRIRSDVEGPDALAPRQGTTPGADRS
jgi:nitrogen regulatory protein PII